MNVDPVTLLAGPRGRRLCLEFALQSTEDVRAGTDSSSIATRATEFRTAVFHVSNELDPGRGTSSTFVAFVRPGTTEPEPEISDHSPEDVARLLEGLPLPTTDARSLLLALVAAVESARYWQEPDGRDILVDVPQVRESLRRFADAIAASPHAAWWAEPARSSPQWTATFREPHSPVGDDAPAAITLERWRTAQIDEEAGAERDRPASPEANWSGTWWSTPPRALLQTTRSLPESGPVGLWLVEDGLGWESAWTEPVDFPSRSRIFELDSPMAWVELCRRYPLEVTASKRHDWYRTTGRAGRWVIPDWSAVAGDLDAVHLSVGGYLETAGRALDVDADLATVLAGWSPDHTYWFSDGVRPTGQVLTSYELRANDWRPAF